MIARAPVPCHVAHMMYRFSAGGMENVVVQLINHLPRDRFRHSIIALTEADPDFVSRIERKDVEIVQLHKPPGQPFRLFPAAYRALRRMKPDVLQTLNLAALEFAPVAAAAGVKRRVHAEHGWDVSDPDGSNRTYRLLRRIYRPFVHEFVAVSRQLSDYLRQHIGIASDHVHLVPNGVDTGAFRPPRDGDAPPSGYPFRRGEHFVFGTVGRLVQIKNQALLIGAFARLVASDPGRTAGLRLAIVGDGPLARDLAERADSAGIGSRIWMPGSRADVAQILRALDVFVLPSFAEGTSCTLQEAMSTGLPIVATDVGGNGDLLNGGRLGQLVKSDDIEALCAAMRTAMRPGEPGESAGRSEIEERYSLEATVARYEAIFLGVSPDVPPAPPDGGPA